MRTVIAILALSVVGADHSARDRAAGYAPREYREAAVRVVIDVYAPSWCSGCSAKVTVLERAYPAIEFRVHGQARQFPEKVANVGGVYPVLWWSAAGREWYINDYTTPADFHKRWEKTHGVAETLDWGTSANGAVSAASRPDQAATPLDEVRRVLALLRPQQHETFIDYGCGDGRWLIEAARTYGCRAVGVEIDPAQAERARRAVAAAGLGDRIEIIEGDATRVSVRADVGVAYLYPDLLQRLKPALTGLRAFATYMHPVEGVSMRQHGDSWVWTRPAPVMAQQPRVAWYGGQAYSGRVCGNPRCSMCAAIARQLGQ